MDLTGKLNRILPQKPKPAEVKIAAPRLDHHLQGREVSTPFGPCYLVEKSFALQRRHGHWPLESALTQEYANLDTLAQSPIGDFQLEHALFLDTETTGLAGGAGTYAFLVGLGCFEGGQFVIRQILMRDYPEELALLYLLEEELRKYKTIVSFNGRTFDLPLLRTRFTLARLGFQGVEGRAELDLLPLSRRLWRQKLDSCSLGSLEHHILGVRRSADIPGFEIPSRYFEFLQTGDGRLLQDILEHNALDLVSMVTLLYRLELTAGCSPDECDCPFEAEALAKRALAKGKPSLALRYLKAARDLCAEDSHYLRILRLTADIFKRLKQYEQAAGYWTEIVKASPADVDACEELAKYYEHKLRDLNAADRITRRALAAAWHSKSPRVFALEHRLQRIERKSARKSDARRA